MSSNFFRNDRGGVNGNKKVGCDSIVMSNDGPSDTFIEFEYICLKTQGSQRLYMSYINGSVIRVFRSSNITSDYAPAPFIVVKNNYNLCYRTSYRYDGLYTIKHVKGKDGVYINEELLDPKNDKVTFSFRRVDINDSDINECNQVGNSDIIDKL